MHKYPNYGNFDLDPQIRVEGYPGAVGDCTERLRASVAAGGRLFAFVLYPGVDKADAVRLAQSVGADVVDADAARLPQADIDGMFRDNLTDDRVFGVMTTRRLEACFDAEKLKTLGANIGAAGGRPVCVVGVGAALLCHDADEIWYFDVTRWEIQLRFRKGAGTWLFDDAAAPQLTKYKAGFFVEWRLADRHKVEIMRNVAVWVDANRPDALRCLSGEAFFGALSQAAHKPFRMQPYYDPSVWGGQWMKRALGLDAADNYGWSFDGVPEENALKFDFDGDEVVFPAMDLVKAFPEALLGGRVYGRFGAEFPIRFDLLDTFEGGNLSLQVHPLTGYIQETFGMHYTQDESYYILDAGEESCVYLGVKEHASPEKLREALERAQAGEGFDAAQFVNKIPVKKHDHVLIPAGTVHCSGKDALVLEISATPYIFTFKLWDWDRLGLDGRPRPVHIAHGMRNIQFDRDTQWVERELVHRAEVLSEETGAKTERTGLHRYEFIETRRYTVTGEKTVSAEDGVTVVNLVDGARGLIRSADGSFSPQEIHYAETFIIPAGAGDFVLAAPDGERVMYIAASVRG